MLTGLTGSQTHLSKKIRTQKTTTITDHYIIYFFQFSTKLIGRTGRILSNILKYNEISFKKSVFIIHWGKIEIFRLRKGRHKKFWWLQALFSTFF